ncbi:MULTISPECIES: GntR family transcriptional regulator [unclassified Actinobaculum]|uniref:GntR family transcriptional regulator n=1 Tax=unclassified Actinobaculum TaxID=2609299 RepID=UPI000D528529|nr:MULTISPECIES: GntR family transcriptional regulator [unclassified Actinobaculum]AWE41605.1 GntR family transcriptional regulator [Actinobaculum sp. 313]RTE49222.1 GntR family transcriptional regulator [Actinobaculum sp. 352]
MTDRSGDSPRIVLDLDDPTPPFEQVRRQISELIVAGALAEAARLPTVRQLAADLRVAPGTVARAYKELEAEGLVKTRRGAGTRVAPGQALPLRQRQMKLEQLTAGFVAAARRIGADGAAIRAAVEAALHEA